METKRASKTNWKHITCCIIILIIFVVTIGIHINAESVIDEPIADSSSEIVPLKANERIPIYSLDNKDENEVELTGPQKLITVEYSAIDSYVYSYKEEIQFFANVFGVNYEDIIKDITSKYEEDIELVDTNIGHLLNSNGEVKTFDTVERGIVEYFYDYIERNPKKVNNKRISYTGSADYVEKLIIYYSTVIYPNVDTNTALSIGAAESGYYKVKYMLSVNNVFGGMSSHGLTKYKNIEYGVLSYVRMLSNGYYGQGLTSLESIGRKYCPTKDSNGNKIASPHWINLVTTAKKKYKTYSYDVKLVDLNQ